MPPAAENGSSTDRTSSSRAAAGSNGRGAPGETGRDRQPGKKAEQQSGRLSPDNRRAFIIAMAFAVAAASLGDTLIKRGLMDLQGAHAEMGTKALDLLTDYWLDAGIFLMIVHFAAFVRALKLGPLSAAVPLRSSSYIFTTLLAKYWLGENVNAERWIAIMMILGGVCVVGRSTGGGGQQGGGEPASGGGNQKSGGGGQPR